MFSLAGFDNANLQLRAPEEHTSHTGVTFFFTDLQAKGVRLRV